MNDCTSTVIIAPMTGRGVNYPTRIACTFQNRCGQIVPDQMRAVDIARLVGKLRPFDPSTACRTLELLQEMF